ncbi:MAG: hypothetical protein R3Y26_01530 [Rikenellaceae bacterium]
MIDKLLLTCLQRNRRLVIPTLGAFIRKNIDGVGVILVFVPFLNKDDGVLLNAFIEWAGVNKEEAQIMLDEYIAHIKSTLKTRGSYVIEGIGALRYDANNSLYLAKDDLPKANVTPTAPKTAPTENNVAKTTYVEERPVETQKQVDKPIVQTVNTSASNNKAHNPEVNEEHKATEVKPVINEQTENTPIINTPVNNLNSQYSRHSQNSQVENTINEQPTYLAPKVETVTIPKQEVTIPQPTANTNTQQHPTYRRKVVTTGEGQNNQRPASNLGDFYFNGDNSSSNESSEYSAFQPNENTKPQVNQPQVSYPKHNQEQYSGQKGNGQRSNVNVQRNNGQVNNSQQNPINKTNVDKDKVNALYGSNKKVTREVQPSERPNSTRPNNTRPNSNARPNNTRPNNNTRRDKPRKTSTSKTSKNTNMTFSVKLVWILAIIAIILTISVIIYAFIYGSEVSLPETTIAYIQQPIGEL